MLHAISEKTREEIGVHCEMEKRRPFTMNEHYFMQSNSGKYTQLINLRRSKIHQDTSNTTANPLSQYPPAPVAANHKFLAQQELLNELARHGLKVKSLEQ